MPVGAWAAMRYMGAEQLRLTRLLCIYGYSIAVFIPAALLCLLPAEALDWIDSIPSLIVAAADDSTTRVYQNGERPLDQLLRITADLQRFHL